jgi:hypothetical protein
MKKEELNKIFDDSIIYDKKIFLENPSKINDVKLRINSELIQKLSSTEYKQLSFSLRFNKEKNTLDIISENTFTQLFFEYPKDTYINLGDEIVYNKEQKAIYKMDNGKMITLYIGNLSFEPKIEQKKKSFLSKFFKRKNGKK